MNFFHWLKWFNREKIILFIASLALALGAILPWYRIYPQALETFETNLLLANALHILAAIFAMVGFAFTFWLGPKSAPRLPVWSGLIAVLLFPYFITTWSPTVAFLAKAYYDQGQRVSQHVEINFPQVQAQWKQNISLGQSTPIGSIFDFAIADSRFFQMSSWDKILVAGLGYSDSFLGFIGRGWAYTVIGLVLAAIAIYLGLEDEKFNVFLRDMGRSLPGVGLLLGILVLSLIWPNLVKHQLDTMFAKGEYHRVVAASQTLASWYPPLSGDSAFLKRLATAGFYGNEPDPALIDFAKGLEHYRLQDFPKAADYFQHSLELQPKRFLTRGYLAAALLNQGVADFNDPNHTSNHRPASAADRFEEALHLFPGHTEALYDLMLARAVNGEFDKSALAAQQIVELQQYQQQPNLALLGQAYVHLVWASYHDGNTTQAWRQYQESLDNNAWRKFGEAKK